MQTQEDRRASFITRSIATYRLRAQAQGIAEIDEEAWGKMMQQRITDGGLQGLIRATPQKCLTEK